MLTASDNGTPVKAVRQIDQNIHTARFLINLFKQSQSPVALNLSRHVMRYLSTEKIALSRLTDAGIVLADRELRATELIVPQATLMMGVHHVVM